tara:strand:+ start:99 stop:272 length:174 start_codon:yes stop_codon:yes gene_type:complete
MLGFFAEREGFEPPVHCCTMVFKTTAFDHSAISPIRNAKIEIVRKEQKISLSKFKNP